MTGSWLVVERSGALWAIPRARLRHLRRGPILILDPEGPIEVDEVHDVLREPERVEVGHHVARLLPEPVVGLGLWENRPVAFLDPDRTLPACLRPTSDPRATEPGSRPPTPEDPERPR